MEELNNMKFGDLIDLLIDIVSKKNNEIHEQQILSKNEVLELFPMFTENTLRKAVKYQGLEYIKSGRNKFYDRNSIEKWIEEQKQKEIYNRFEDIKF